MMFARWASIVFTLMPSVAAACLVALPFRDELNDLALAGRHGDGARSSCAPSPRRT